MNRTAWIATCALLFVANCGAAIGERAVVHRVGPDDLLKLRGGPGLDYSVLLGLPDGTELIRRDCVTEVGQLWCRVSLARHSAIGLPNGTRDGTNGNAVGLAPTAPKTSWL